MTLTPAAIRYELICPNCSRQWGSIENRFAPCPNGCYHESKVKGLTQLYELKDDE